MLFVVTGTSGAGKGTIVARLRRQFPDLWWSVSATTRAARAGEVDGDDYHFLTRDDFQRLRDDGGFLEWFEVYGDFKGTPRAPIEERLARGEDVLLELDIQGAVAVQDRFPGDSVVVFVRAPNRQEQQRRLEARGEDAATIERRLAQAPAEEALAEERFDHVVVNDDLERAVEEVSAIIEVSRSASP